MSETGSSATGEGNELPGKESESGTIIKKWVNQTKYGIVFFAAGIGITWIPYLKYFGLLFFPVGLIGMALGRRAFGGKQGLYLAASVIIFVFSQIFLLDIETSMFDSIAGSAPVASAVLPIIRNYFVAILAVSYIGSISFVLPGWRLSRRLGKGFFVLAMVVGIIVNALIYNLLFPDLSFAVSSFLITHNVSQLDSTLSYFQSLDMLNAFWYLIMVGAFALIYDDIDRGILRPVSQIPEDA